MMRRRSLVAAPPGRPPRPRARPPTPASIAHRVRAHARPSQHLNPRDPSNSTVAPPELLSPCSRTPRASRRGMRDACGTRYAGRPAHASFVSERRVFAAQRPNRTPWAGCDFSPEESITAGRWCAVRSSDVLTFLKIIWPHPTLLGSFRSLGCAAWRRGCSGAVGRDDALHGDGLVCPELVLADADVRAVGVEAVGVGVALVVPIMHSTSSCSQPMQAKPGSQWQTYLLAPPSSQVPCSSPSVSFRRFAAMS